MRGRKRVGVALGGGVARGIAHIGVLAVLEESGIPIDYVSGTSVGAVIAANYCAGLTPRELLERARKMSWFQIARPVWPKRGFVSFDKLGDWMVRNIGDLEFKDLKVPCVVVATDLEAGVPVKLMCGKVAQAVQASCSVPGVVTPVLVEGRWLCEGGVTDMLPVDAAREIGSEYVIGVDVFAHAMRKRLGPIGYGFEALEIMLERTGQGVQEADCLIAPALAGKTYLRFSKYAELYELGRQAALGKVEEIRKAVGNFDNSSSSP